MKDISTVKIPIPEIRDDASVRTHAFPQLDTLPASVVDTGKVRMGFYTPPFPAAPAK